MREETKVKNERHQKILEIIEKYPCETLNGLEVLGQSMQNGCLDKHLLNGIIPFISEGNKSIKLLMGGIAPNYYADYVLHEYMEQMEKGFTKLMNFWKSIYLRKG